MYIESNDPEGAKVYDMIIRQILQDLVLPPSIDDMRAYVNPDEVCFIIAIKMRKTSKHITLKEVAKVNYEAEDDTTVVLIDDENYLPNILKTLWNTNGRENVHQPSRYGRIYDAIFRIVPEGFKIMKDISRDDIVSVIATDELIKDEWVEKAEGYIVELNTPKTWD